MKLGRMIFNKTLQLLYGKGLGQFAFARESYQLLFRMFYPEACIRVNGHKMYTDGTWWTSGLLLDAYEKFEVELFKRRVKSGMTVVDIGANIGYYTLIAASLVGESGKVYAIEPEPTNYALLAKNVEVNGFKNVRLIQEAISNEIGTSKLLLDSNHTGKHRLCDSQDGEEQIRVNVTTLDELLGDEPIDVIKMDIEGAEAKAIQGMRYIMKRNKNLTIFTECVPMFLKRSGSSPEEYLSNLVEFGFKIYQIDEKERHLKPVSVFNCITDPTNLLCNKDKVSIDEI